MKQHITLQNHQFSSVQSMIPSLLHTARVLFFCRLFSMLRRLRFCHYKHRRSLLFKYFKISSNWTATKWPYLVGVTGNICFGPTNNASVWHRLGVAERNAWSINKYYHYKLHNLDYIQKHIKRLIIFYVLTYVYFQFSCTVFSTHWIKNYHKKNENILLISVCNWSVDTSLNFILVMSLLTTII